MKGVYQRLQDQLRQGDRSGVLQKTQCAGIIAGKVICDPQQSASNHVIELYVISVSGKKALLKTTQTNLYGQFLFNRIPAGSYWLQLSAAECIGASKKTEVNGAGELTYVTLSCC